MSLYLKLEKKMKLMRDLYNCLFVISVKDPHYHAKQVETDVFFLSQLKSKGLQNQLEYFSQTFLIESPQL